MKLYSQITILALALPVVFSTPSFGQKHATPVPPGLEIEVIDPGVDPLGNPAVVLQDGRIPGQMQVDIPPTVIVHRFYYTGDRTFQGPMLPGGPCMLVLNHPKTNERCYISAQMLPGAPKITYRNKSVEYDYGENGITVCFGFFGPPSVKYRSGKTWMQHASHLVHAEQIHQHLTGIGHHAHETTKRTKTMASGLAAGASDASKVVTLPLQNIARMMPFGAALTSGDLEKQLAEKAAQHKKEKELQQHECRTKTEGLDMRTNR